MRHYDLWMRKYREKREELLSKFKGYGSDIERIRVKIPAERIFFDVPKDSVRDYRMCFVDGGEGMRNLLGCSLYFIRASGLVAGGGGEKFIRDLDMDILGLDDDTKNRVELLRDIMEFRTAKRCVLEEKPEFLFLDGSLYAKATRTPVKCDEFRTYKEELSDLLETCKKESVRVVGISEDTKSRIFKHYLESVYGVKFPELMTDPAILQLISDRDVYRTVEFAPSAKGYPFPTVYVRCTGVSMPLRIDTTSGAMDEIVSLVVKLSRGSRSYGYPVPLYIAHLDAKIDKKHSDWGTSQLMNYLIRRNHGVGSALLGKSRRDSRPG